jgi:hypothetical protein
MDYFMTDFPISDYQQIQSFGNITIDGKNNVFTINQVIQISASAIYSRQFKPTSPYKGLKKCKDSGTGLTNTKIRLVC